MHGRISRLTYSTLTAALLHLAACGGDSADPASFAKASDLQKQRAIAAAGPTDAALGLVYGSILAGLPADETCPKISHSGDTFTVTTNCTTESGDKLSGTLTGKNLPSFFGEDEHDPSKPSIVTFENFSIDDTSDDNEDVTLDGKVTLNSDTSLTADFSATLGGIKVYSDATWNRTAERTTAAEGSYVEVDGLGSADIKGSWNLDSDAPAGVLELHGSDVLKADFGATASGCVPLTVDGNAAGQICQELDEI